MLSMTSSCTSRSAGTGICSGAQTLLLLYFQAHAVLCQLCWPCLPSGVPKLLQCMHRPSESSKIAPAPSALLTMLGKLHHHPRYMLPPRQQQDHTLLLRGDIVRLGLGIIRPAPAVAPTR